MVSEPRPVYDEPIAEPMLAIPFAAF
jgi:hypothetical protein